MSSIVNEVRRKSPNVLHKWVANVNEDQKQSIDVINKRSSVVHQVEDRGVTQEWGITEGTSHVVQEAAVVIDNNNNTDKDSNKQDDGTVHSRAASKLTTITARLKLNELYKKINHSRGNLSLFVNKRRMDGGTTMKMVNNELSMASEDALGTPLAMEGASACPLDVVECSSILRGQSGGLKKTSSLHNSQDEEQFQFSFEDFSFADEKHLAEADDPKVATLASGLESSTTSDYGRAKRHVNMGEIGRCSSANNSNTLNNHDSGIDADISSHQAKRTLLADIGRRFSEMIHENTSCEFQSNSLQNENRSLGNFRPNSVPVSPVPRMMYPNNTGVSYRGGSSDLSMTMDRQKKRHSLFRDYSTQSDSSRCSSVESLLESRKPDAESILINLGFGPIQSEDVLSKLPKRFLKPSQLNGIDTETFLKQQKIANDLHEHSVLGYRGLVGNPHMPPSMIVAKIMERFQVNEQNRFLLMAENTRPASAPPSPATQT